MSENIMFFSNKKGKTHLIMNIESGGGENLVRVPTLLSGIVQKKNLKNVPPLTLTKLGKEESCNLLQVKLTSAAEKKQRTMARFTWVCTYM